MGRRVLWRHIWGYTVCLCPTKGTSGLNELSNYFGLDYYFHCKKIETMSVSPNCISKYTDQNKFIRTIMF